MSEIQYSLNRNIQIFLQRNTKISEPYKTALYLNKRFIEKDFSKGKELEDPMLLNSKYLFGQHIIIIEGKQKIEHKTLGGTIPDAFLFFVNK